MIGAAVCAVVLIMLPLVEDFANVFAGLAGALVGAALRLRGRARPPRAAHPELTRRAVAVDKFTVLTPELHRYAVEHSSFRDGVVPGVEAAGEEMGDLALMQIAGDQAAFMTILVQATGARRALEVGTFLGYGAIAIARGLPEDGELLVLRDRRGVRRPAREHLERGGPGRTGSSIRVGPGARDAARPARRRAVRLRLRRRRQAGLPRLLRGVPAPAAPGRPDAARQRLHGRPRRSTPRPTTRERSVVRELNDRIAADERVEVRDAGHRRRGHDRPQALGARWRSRPATRRGPELVRDGMPPCWGLIAEGSGGSVWRRGGVSARSFRRRPTARSSTPSSTRTPRSCWTPWTRSTRPTSAPASGPGPSGCPRPTPMRPRAWSARVTSTTARRATWACRWPTCACPRGPTSSRSPSARTTPSWRASTRSPTATHRARTSPSPRRRCRGSASTSPSSTASPSAPSASGRTAPTPS